MGTDPRKLAHTAITVGSSTTEAAAANDNRTYLLAVNDADEAITSNSTTMPR